MAKNLNLIPTNEKYTVICLGDICAGNTAGSKAAIEWLIEYDAISITGSHDLPIVNDAALERYLKRAEDLRREGRGNPELFKRFYYDALRVRNGLNEMHLNYLASLPELYTIREGSKIIQLIHHSLDTEYNRTGNRIINKKVARYNFDNPLFTGDILLVGHSHIPLAYREHDGTISETIFSETSSIKLQEGRYILNPGSLQKIRTNTRHNKKTKVFEGEERISYGILDLDESTYTVRLVYPR